MCYWLLTTDWRGVLYWFRHCQDIRGVCYADPPAICPDCGKVISFDDRFCERTMR
jgi:hypothetical protein